MCMYYAGIGSRETPSKVLKFFTNLAKELHLEYNLTLRSGGASGADEAFETGCDEVNGDKEIYLPWRLFNDSVSGYIVGEDEEAREIAERFHPYWHNLSNGARKLQTRNSFQILGHDLKTPSSFIVCYTKDGKGQGGTGQAIRIANAYNIPVFDFGSDEDLNHTYQKLIAYLKILKRTEGNYPMVEEQL